MAPQPLLRPLPPPVPVLGPVGPAIATLRRPPMVLLLERVLAPALEYEMFQWSKWHELRH